MREELIEKYPKQWVALYHDEKEFQIFVAPSQRDLIQERDARGLDKDLVAFAFLETERYTVIL